MSLSEVLLPDSSVVIVSHDAGGAELLSSYVRRYSDNEYYFVIEGPALSIFERKLGPIVVHSLQDAIYNLKAGCVICGTSWQSDLEYNAIVMARAAGVFTVAYVDHWVNYEARFIRSGVISLPDEIWVGDNDALKIAKSVFLASTIRYVKNPYYLDFQDEVAEFDKQYMHMTSGFNILYVCEPIREHALLQYGNERHWGYVEEDAISYFLNNVLDLLQPIGRILIRPHPSEKNDKYDWVFTDFDLPIERNEASSLIEDIVTSDVVVGCESMAMIMSLHANKRVISCIPPEGRPCSLPHQYIESFQQLISDKNFDGDGL
jgi:hypothetical protein